MELLHLMPKLLQLERFFGNARVFGLDGIVERTQFFVEAGKLRSLVFEMTLGYIMGVLEQSILGGK